MISKTSKKKALEALYEPYKKQCAPCPLDLETPHNFVSGYGNPETKLMLIGEAPGQY